MEGYLNYLKKEYEKTQATAHLKESGWGELARRIGFLETPKKNTWLRNFALAFAVLLLFIFGTYQVAQAALPGDKLYPVKILSENIIRGTSGSSQVAIDHRAEEIVILSKKQEVNKESLERISIEYKEVVNQEKQQIKVSGEPDTNFRRKLDEHHQEFDKISHDNPEIGDEIKDAQEASDHNSDRNED
jgi:hypothetical protein